MEEVKEIEQELRKLTVKIKKLAKYVRGLYNTVLAIDQHVGEIADSLTETILHGSPPTKEEAERAKKSLSALEEILEKLLGENVWK